MVILFAFTSDFCGVCFLNQLQATALTFCTEPMVKCIQMSVSQAGHQQNLIQCTQVFQELLESSDCDTDSIHPRSPRKLLTSVLTSEIVDICWHARTAKKNGSLSRTSLHNQASDVLLLPSWSRYVYNRSRIRRVMMSLMFLIWSFSLGRSWKWIPKAKHRFAALAVFWCKLQLVHRVDEMWSFINSAAAIISQPHQPQISSVKHLRNNMHAADKAYYDMRNLV